MGNKQYEDRLKHILLLLLKLMRLYKEKEPEVTSDSFFVKAWEFKRLDQEL